METLQAWLTTWLDPKVVGTAVMDWGGRILGALVIFIVGHIFIPIILAVETIYTPAYWVHAVLWAPLLVGASVGLLQPIKGAVVGLQWSAGMHGFEAAKRARLAAAAAA